MPHMSGFGGSVRWAPGSPNKPDWADGEGLANSAILDWDLSAEVTTHEVSVQGTNLRAGLTPTLANGMERWIAHVGFLVQSDMGPGAGPGAENVNPGLAVIVWLCTAYPAAYVGNGVLTQYSHSCPLDGPIVAIATIKGSGTLLFDADVTS